MASKKKSQRVHARRRFWERYGVNFTLDMEQRMLNKIRKGESRLIHTESNRTTIRTIELDNREFTVVHDKERKTIVTALEPIGVSKKTSALLTMLKKRFGGRQTIND